MSGIGHPVDLNRLYGLLYEHYGDLGWWPARDAYEMCVGAILTQNTSWSSVEKAIARFEGRLSPEYVRSISDEVLTDIIRPSGFFNQKAARIRALTQWLEGLGCAPDECRLSTQELRCQLLDIKGVGRETADSILVYAFGRLSFVVDAYTRRLLTRLGYTLPGDYDGIRRMIEASVPAELYIYNNFHALIVEQCKQHCLKKPRCTGCPLSEVCTRSGVQSVEEK